MRASEKLRDQRKLAEALTTFLQEKPPRNKGTESLKVPSENYDFEDQIACIQPLLSPRHLVS